VPKTPTEKSVKFQLPVEAKKKETKSKQNGDKKPIPATSRASYNLRTGR